MSAAPAVAQAPAPSRAAQYRKGIVATLGALATLLAEVANAGIAHGDAARWLAVAISIVGGVSTALGVVQVPNAKAELEAAAPAEPVDWQALAGRLGAYVVSVIDERLAAADAQAPQDATPAASTADDTGQAPRAPQAAQEAPASPVSVDAPLGPSALAARYR